MEYVATIGLEIHVELKTKTKMFCQCLNDSDEKHPNINVCPVCMGHPGTLPVINKEAVKKVLTVGRALNGKLAEYSQFDRKNYFYPDLPKGYQISQYKYPLVKGGELNGIKITRIHLEEDTGKLAHFDHGSAVDFNRAGVPLMELVTEPEIKNSEEARKFAEELQLILRYLDVSDANMEKGEMRVEVNISLSQVSNLKSQKLGTKVEIKNLNSFRAVEKAVNHEIKRQGEVLKKGEKIKQETRGWSALGGENKGETFSQREKEESHDYRYFPEPDLPALNLTKLNLGEFIIPELPQQKRERFKKKYGIKNEQIEILVGDKNLSDYLEKIISGLKEKNEINIAVNYLLSDLLSLMKEKMISFSEILIEPQHFSELIKMTASGKISSRVSKDTLRKIVETGKSPFLVVEEENLWQKSDQGLLDDIVRKIIKENRLAVDEYKRGKENAMQFLVGCGMKLTKGVANPETLKKSLKEAIK